MITEINFDKESGYLNSEDKGDKKRTPEELIAEADKNIAEYEAMLAQTEKEIQDLEASPEVGSQTNELKVLWAKAEQERDFIDAMRSQKRDAEHQIRDNERASQK